MRILYLGDIVGEKTIEVLRQNLDTIKAENKINLVLVNAENVTQGKGLSEKHECLWVIIHYLNQKLKTILMMQPLLALQI